MKLVHWPRFVWIFVLFSLVSGLQAGVMSWVDSPSVARSNSLDPKPPTSPPREYFSINTLYLGNKILVHVGYDLINQNYVVMPSPTVQRVAKVGDKLYVTIQQYFPELENKILAKYNIPANKLSYLYITGYEVYDQEGVLVDRIVLPEGAQYRPPQFYSLVVSDKVKLLSFIFTFNGRTAWSDAGINTDLQGIYRSLADIGVDRDSSIHLEVNPGNELKTFEVLTSHENQQLQEILSEFHHIVAWGRMAQKEELINKIIDLKNFEAIDIDFARGVEDLKKYPLIFGNPLDPKWQSVINHISSERLTESEMNAQGSISAKLGLGNFFSFGGRASSKRNSRLKEMVKFDVQGAIYIPKSLHFTTRMNESFDLVKNLVFQAYDQLEEATFRIGVGVSLDQNIPRTTLDHLFEGEQLNKGESLISNNGKFVLYLQDDGNLVLYRKGENSLQWMWDSRSSAGRAVSRCLMQPDGNLVIYGYPDAIWNSQTYGHPGAYLVLQDDGNLVIYHNDKAIWWTGTH